MEAVDWTAVSVMVAVVVAGLGFLSRQMHREVGQLGARMDRLDGRFDRLEARFDRLEEQYIRHLEAHATH